MTETDLLYEGVIQLATISTARRISVLSRMRERALAHGLTDVVAHIDLGLAHAQGVRVIESTWLQQRTPRRLYAEGVRPLDRQVVRMFTSVRAVAQANTVGLDPADPTLAHIQAMLEDVFPRAGAVGHVQAWVERVVAAEEAVSKLQTEYAALVATLGQTERVQRLAALVAKYRAAINAGPATMSFDVVARARKRSHRFLAEVVCMVIGAHPDSDNPDHMERRKDLLAAVVEQERIARAQHRARRRNSTDASAEPSEPPVIGEPGEPGEPPVTGEPSTEPGEPGEPSEPGEPGVEVTAGS